MIVGDDRLWLSLETNHCVSACTTCLGCVGVQVWSTKMVDGHGECQVETCRSDGLGVVKDGCEV